jgi:hypothetical protein
MKIQTTNQSGRRKLPAELRRSQVLRIMVTEGDLLDLQVIAAAWGVPIATAGYAMLATELATARSIALDIGSLGVEVGASIRICAAQKPIRVQRRIMDIPGIDNAE